MKLPLNQTALSLLCLALLFFCVRVSYGQEKILYLNEDGKPVKEKQAVLLVQHLKLSDSVWESNVYEIDGPRWTSMRFSDEKGNVLNGRYLTYDRKGNCDTVGYYVAGLREGPWQVMTSKGRVLRELDYNNGKLVGKKDSIQLNEEGEKMKDSLWHGRTIVESESEFPGGSQGWLQYLNHNLKYPQRAFDKSIQGMPIVVFIVEKDGHVEPSNIFLYRSVEYSIDQEALKAIRQSPNWTAAVQDGKEVRSYKKQPVVFSLSRK
jgi:protein TonB